LEETDDLLRINQAAELLNSEASDVLEYQALEEPSQQTELHRD